MPDPGIEKKKRKRSARVYINANRPLAVPLDEIAAEFPPDDDDDGQPPPARTRRMAGPGTEKRDFTQSRRRALASEGKALPDGSYPVETAEDLHNAAVLARSGHGDVAGARKLIARRAKELGVANPLESQKAAGNPVDQPGGRPVTDRLSPSRASGQGSPSSGDHNAGWQDPMNVPGPRQLALGHPSMRQGTTTPFPLSMMQTFNGDNQFGDRDLTLGGGRVNLQRLDAAGATGLSSPPGNPASRPMPHTAPIGQNNGGHSLSQPEARHPASMKNSDRLEVMKRHLFPGSGGAR